MTPQAAHHIQQSIDSCAEANLTADIRKVERQLAQVRDQIGSLARELPHTSPLNDDRIAQLTAKVERLDAQIELNKRDGNDGMVTQLTHAQQNVQRQLDQLRLQVGGAPRELVQRKLRELRAEEDKLDVKLFELNEAYYDLARQHDARCAAEDREARARAARAAALEDLVAGEMPCE
jgi:chromosome segregation ATPase